MTMELCIITVPDEQLLTNLNNKLDYFTDRIKSWTLANQVIDSKLIIRVNADTTSLGEAIETEDWKYIIKHTISEQIAQHVVDIWFDRILVREIIRTKVPPSDRDIILEKSKSCLKASSESLEVLLSCNRKNRIHRKILAYLQDNDRLILEGFINFNMSDLTQELKYAVELACEELKNEQKYGEFVKLLRYFIDSQPAKCNVVYVSKDEGLFIVQDSQNNIICDEDFCDDDTIEDILVSILLCLYPKKIVLRTTGDSKAYKSLREAFDDIIVDEVISCPVRN